MSYEKIFTDNYGQPFEVVFLDVDTGTVQDISSYTTLEIVFEKPDGTTSTQTAAFSTDGTDGAIRWTVTEDFWTAGRWWARGKVSISGTAVLYSEREKFDVQG